MRDMMSGFGPNPNQGALGGDDVGPNGGDMGKFADQFPNVRRRDPGLFGNSMQGQSILPQYGKPPMGPGRMGPPGGMPGGKDLGAIMAMGRGPMRA